MATGITIWLAGECGHPDFAAPTHWLRSQCQCVDRETSPAAIVVCQSRPGSVSRRQVESLHRLAPLARLILVTGPWCDGERLNSKATIGVARIRWHQWQERLPQELSPSNRLPRTTSDGERLEQSLCGLIPGMYGGRSVTICTDCRASFDVLADACRFLGLNSNWSVKSALDREIKSSDLLLLDGWQNEQATESVAGASLRMLLLDFPRPEDERRAAELGFAAVIARPLLLSDLVAALQRNGLATSDAAARVA